MQSCECGSNCCRHTYGDGTLSLCTKRGAILDGVIVLRSDELLSLMLSHDCCQLLANMLGLVDVTWLKMEPHYRWRCRAHTAEGEADHTMRCLIPLIIGEARITDDVAFKETRHAGLGRVDLHLALAISDDVLQDVLHKMPEEGELRPAPFVTADAVLGELAVEVELIKQTQGLAVLVLGNGGLMCSVIEDPFALNLPLPSTLPMGMCTGMVVDHLACSCISMPMRRLAGLLGTLSSMPISLCISMSVSISVGMSIGIRAGITAVGAISIAVGLILGCAALELEQLDDIMVCVCLRGVIEHTKQQMLY